MNFEFGRNGSYDNFLTPIELKMLHYGFKNFDFVLQKKRVLVGTFPTKLSSWT